MPRSCRDCLPMMPTELSAVLPARHIQEECGVFGVYAPETTDVAPLAYYALYALQHRGQESAGIAVNDDGVFTAYRDVGLVNEVFPAERLRSLGTGTIAVGHVRYGTTGVRQQAERPAHPGEPLQGPHGPGPQRQPHQLPRSCARSWRARAPSSRPPRTPRSSPTSSSRSVCAPPPSRRRSPPPWTGSRGPTPW